MPADQVLLDTNAYLRLAQKLNPLLNASFGPNKTRLFVIREFESEFRSSTRLQTDFGWVMESNYVLNRRKRIRIPRDKSRLVGIAKRTLTSHVRANGLSVSNVDCSALAVGRVLTTIVVTDDRDMRRLADTFKIRTMRSLALLGRMLRVGHIDKHKVREIVTHWRVTNDCPANFQADYARIFGESPPNPT